MSRSSRSTRAVDEDFETIPCGWKYVSVCLILPCLNGSLNGFVWPGYTLYLEEMGWSVTNAGLAVTIGFVLRMTIQQMQLRAGYWLIVPLSAMHLAFAILSFSTGTLSEQCLLKLSWQWASSQLVQSKVLPLIRFGPPKYRQDKLSHGHGEGNCEGRQNC